MNQFKFLDETIQNLRKNNMQVTLISNKLALQKKIIELIPPSSVVAFGGSMTLKETGVHERLHQLSKEHKIQLLDFEGSKENKQQICRQSFFSDFYLTSTNAITKDGCLYNVDGYGNRVAAMIFGPTNVIVVAGINKLVLDHSEAEQRIRTLAAPKNTKRLHLDTPCATAGMCMNCSSKSRICCSYTCLKFQRIPNRIHVIIVEEPFGY